VVAAITVIPFLPALQAGFVNWDDQTNFLNNPHFRGLGWTHLKWMFTTTLLAVYAPLAWLTLGVNHALGGMDPWGYHLGNLLIHAASGGVLYLVARRLLEAGFAPDGPAGRSRTREEDARHGEWAPAIEVGAAVAALAWGVHPLRVESVAWVTERRDVLSGLFYLLAVLAYLRGADRDRLLRGRWHAVTLLAFAAALLSKGIVMTLPLTLLLLDVYPLRRLGLGWRALVLEKTMLAVLAGLGAAMALFAVGQATVWTGYESYGLGPRVAMVGYSVWFYPWKMLWPTGLSPLYELPPIVDPFAPRFLVPIAATAMTTLILVWRRRQWPGALTSWIHSAIAVAPVSGVVHAGHQLAHDRFSYVSGLGFAILAGAGVAWVLRKRQEGRIGRPIAEIVLLAVILTLVGLSAGAWRQSLLWHDSETLWRGALRASPTCSICHANLGIAIVRSPGGLEARRAEAEQHLRTAIGLRPDRPDPYYTLASLLASERRYGAAEELLRTYMTRFPDLADGPHRLGMYFREQGRNTEAIELLRRAQGMHPEVLAYRRDLGEALNNQGGDLVRDGRLDEALPFFREAAEWLPADAQPLRNLGQTFVLMGSPNEAVALLMRAIALEPRSAPGRYWLARAYLSAGARAQAETEIAALREIDPALAERAAAGR
ncbi:MAG TPA: tetratricopeptide repeat protein, partial [Candidatus Limnocylindrales bacterium]|nr:tetratricopeptide repeat protein [Candidatus Limnocylindrales bacterium]